MFLPVESDPALEQAAAAARLVIEGKEALAPILLTSYNAQARSIVIQDSQSQNQYILWT